MKACPFCAEQIQDAARICRFCSSVLDGRGGRLQTPGTPPNLIVYQLREWAAGPPKTPKRRRRISIWCIVLSVVWAGVTTWLFVIAPVRDKTPAFLVGGFLAIVPLAVLTYDLLRIFPESCTDPARVLKGFGQAMGRKNYGLAVDFLAGPERSSSDERRVPPLQEVTPGRFRFGVRGGFFSYWDNICANRPGRPRNVSFSVRDVRPLAPGFATGILRMSLQTHSTIGDFLFGILGHLLSRSTTTVEWEKLLVEKAGRWFLANGEASDKRDRELIAEIRNPSPPEIEL